VAAKTGITVFISVTTTDVIELPAPNLGFTTVAYSKVLASDCDSDRQPEVAIYSCFGVNIAISDCNPSWLAFGKKQS